LIIYILNIKILFHIIYLNFSKMKYLYMCIYYNNKYKESKILFTVNEFEEFIGKIIEAPSSFYRQSKFH